MRTIFKRKGNATHPLKNKKQNCVVYTFRNRIKFSDEYVMKKSQAKDLIIFPLDTKTNQS